ncbi:MAG TPA: hypothetical protein VGR54_07680 [Nitrosopumilaceae archaeon]|nr:hypothetical protein [Nitrosopumilaceae archaeon]
MNPKVEINSLSINKLKNEQNSFVKYDIEASLDEVENMETKVVLKYKFVLLSNPTNIKISVDGFTTIFGNETEISKHLSPDEKNIPSVVNTIYQEVFPLFYIVSKSMQIPCPAYRLSEISSSRKNEAEAAPVGENKVLETTDDANASESINNLEIKTDEQIESEAPNVEEQIIQKSNVSSV